MQKKEKVLIKYIKNIYGAYLLSNNHSLETGRFLDQLYNFVLNSKQDTIDQPKVKKNDKPESKNKPNDAI
ncbi:MAG: hypothetical protein RR404_00730 [Bacilli bacterium]